MTTATSMRGFELVCGVWLAERSFVDSAAVAAADVDSSGAERSAATVAVPAANPATTVSVAASVGSDMASWLLTRLSG